MAPSTIRMIGDSFLVRILASLVIVLGRRLGRAHDILIDGRCHRLQNLDIIFTVNRMSMIHVVHNKAKSPSYH